MLLVLWAAPVSAEPDFFGRGDGHAGPLSVVTAGTVLNFAVPLPTPLARGSTVIGVNGQGFSAGDLILIIAVSGSETWPDAGILDLSASQPGRWELARVASVTMAQLQLTAPLDKSFDPPGVQVVRVPEYSQASISPGASVVASAWDGGTGGVVAMFVDGPLIVEGRVTASGTGARGGAYRLSPNISGCVDGDAPFPEGAARGEGLVLASYATKVSGSNRATTGGGGGICNDSGGGGGGHGAMGGNGGASYDGSRDVGGAGGARLLASFPNRLTFGGGGGSGWGNDNAGTSGGNGGGIVWIRAASLSGNGAIEANGATAASALSAPDDGLGGGGAGGSVLVQISGSAVCRSIEAGGGDGGNSFDGPTGPGGGGAGGRATLVASTFAGCPVTAFAGLAGVATGPFKPPSRGAHPTSAERATYGGVVATSDAGFLPPAPPVIVAPAEAAQLPGGFEVRVSAAGADSVWLRLDGTPSRIYADDAGVFTTFIDGGLVVGAHVLTAQSEAPGWRSSDSAPRTFFVPSGDAGTDGGTSSPRRLTVGCGCATVDSPALLLMLVAFALRLTRVRS